MRKIWLLGIVMLFLCSIVYAYPASMTYEIDPCVSLPWGGSGLSNATSYVSWNGTPLSVSVTATACPTTTTPWQNCDKVQAKVALYFGDSNIQVDETYAQSTYYDSSKEFTFGTDVWFVNKTGNYTMRIYVRSNDTDYLWNYTDFDFEVVNKTYYDYMNLSEKYVWYGDCETTGQVGAGESINESNAITATLEGIEEQYSWSATLLWILLMVAVAVILWFFTADFGSAAGIGSVAIIEFLLMLIGMYLGFIPFWILWLMMFVAALISGIKIYNLIGGKN